MSSHYRPSSSLRHVVFGTPSNNDALTIRFGCQQGVFERLGIDLELKTLFGGPAIADAFHSGTIEVGSLGSPSALVPMSKGARFQVVASGCRQAAHLYLGVRVGIDDWGGLRGSRIGVLSVGSCPSWIVQKILTVHGLDPVRDVELVPLHGAYPQIVDWVANGKLDACLVTEPNLSIGEARGILKIWAAAYEPQYLPDFQWIVRVANEALLARDPDLVATVLEGCNVASHLAVTETEAFLAFMAHYYGTSIDEVRPAIRREVARYQTDGKLAIPGLEMAVQMMHELGGIDRRVTVDSFCDFRFQ